MSVINAKIKLNPLLISGDTVNYNLINDYINIKFTFNSKNNLIDLQQEIDSITQTVTNNMINDAVDGEKIRYKSTANPAPPILSFWFNKNGNYDNSFIYADFDNNEITKNYNNFLNSFFVLDFFDNYDINNQNKLFTLFLTKKGTVPQYTINNKNQFYYFHIPNYYISQQTGSTSVGYVRFMFYNSKTGKISIFYNDENKLLTNSNKIHFKVELNHENKTWKFISSTYPNIKAVEFEKESNLEYMNKLNNTINTMELLAYNTPEGYVFSVKDDGIYYSTT